MFERRHSYLCVGILVQIVGVWDRFAVRNRNVLEKEKTLMIGIWALGSLSTSASCLNSASAEKKKCEHFKRVLPYDYLGIVDAQGVVI